MCILCHCDMYMEFINYAIESKNKNKKTKKNMVVSVTFL